MDDIGYVGDQATVLPDNTSALLHFSSQFAKMEHQRRADKAAAAAADEKRRNDYEKTYGNLINSKEFHTNATSQGLIDNELQQTHDIGSKMMAAGIPEYQVTAFTHDKIHKTLSKARSYNDLDNNLKIQAAEKLKTDPSLNVGKLIDAARTLATYKQDKDGNPVINEQVDPSHPWIDEAYSQTPNIFHTAEGTKNIYQNLFDKEPKNDVLEHPEYDVHGNLTYSGIKGKIPGFINIVKDKNNKTVLNEDGSPKIDIKGSENYKINGRDYVDDKGRNVKVLSDVAWQQLPSAIKADAHGKMLDVIKTPVNFDGKGESNFSPDSEYAKMLEKNIAYQTLNGIAQSKYHFTTPDDKSFERKRALHSQYVQDQNLGISKKRLSLSEEAAQRANNKANSNGVSPANFLKDMSDRYGEDVQDVQVTPPQPTKFNFLGFPKPAKDATYGNVRFIPVTADSRDLDIMVGKADKKGKRPIEPTVLKNRDGSNVLDEYGNAKLGYIYNPETNNAVGKDGKEINESAVSRNFMHRIKKGESVQMPTTGMKQPMKPLKESTNNSSKIAGLKVGALN